MKVAEGPQKRAQEETNGKACMNTEMKGSTGEKGRPYIEGNKKKNHRNRADTAEI